MNDPQGRNGDSVRHLAMLEAQWHQAFAALRSADLEADADDPIAARYRAASNAVNHAYRSLDYAIATGTVPS